MTKTLRQRRNCQVEARLRAAEVWVRVSLPPQILICGSGIRAGLLRRLGTLPDMPETVPERMHR